MAKPENAGIASDQLDCHGDEGEREGLDEGRGDEAEAFRHHRDSDAEERQHSEEDEHRGVLGEKSAMHLGLFRVSIAGGLRPRAANPVTEADGRAFD